jgi:hypothetical protein
MYSVVCMVRNQLIVFVIINSFDLFYTPYLKYNKISTVWIIKFLKYIIFRILQNIYIFFTIYIRCDCDRWAIRWLQKHNTVIKHARVLKAYWNKQHFQ